MTIVDVLVANPGFYVGFDREAIGGLVAPARMVVSPLPGGAGVTLDYEIFNPTPERPPLGHIEHTVIARAHGLGVVMAVADTHAGSVVVLRETAAGVFEPGPEGSPYPMKVVIVVPGPGQLHHQWWYASPGDDPVPRELAELTRQS